MNTGPYTLVWDSLNAFGRILGLGNYKSSDIESFFVKLPRSNFETSETVVSVYFPHSLYSLSGTNKFTKIIFIVTYENY